MEVVTPILRLNMLLAGFTKQLALDYAEAGIQVFGIAPGAVKTAMTAADFEPGGLSMTGWLVKHQSNAGLSQREIAEFRPFFFSKWESRVPCKDKFLTIIDGGWSLK